jgi:hypothetical protein
LLGEIILLGAVLPDAASMVGVMLIVVGVLCYTWFQSKAEGT